MALGKYAEDNYEIYLDRMAMMEHASYQDYGSRISKSSITDAKNNPKEKN